MTIDFKAATDTLFDKTGADELAAELGCNPQSIKQARMEPEKAGHRSPPPGWQAGVAKVARQKAKELLKLAEKLA